MTRILQHAAETEIGVTSINVPIRGKANSSTSPAGAEKGRGTGIKMGQIKKREDMIDASVKNMMEEEVLQELSLELPESFRKPEFLGKIRLENMDEDGYEIRSSGKEIQLRYGTRRDIGRALLRIAAEELTGETGMGLGQMDLDADGTDTSILAGQCAFTDFGIMLDCSRGAVPTVETLKKFIRLGALMGYSYLGLYTEDTMKVEGEPYFGYMRGAYTPEEIRECDAYAHQFGMELRPYLETLAHINQIVRYKDYAGDIDTGDILEVGTARTEELIDHILAQTASVYSTKYVNIGMDEAELVGLGKYRRDNGYHPQEEVMRSHLEMVLRLCRKYGLIPQMWSDMFFKMAGGGYYTTADEKLKDVRVPEEVELGYWDYYSQDYDHYVARIRQHKLLTDKVAFAGGAWKWTGFAPHNRYSILAGKAALRACRDEGVQNVVITCWGDDGAEADPFSVLPALFADAEEAWHDGCPEDAFTTLTGLSLKDFCCLDDINASSEDPAWHNNSAKYLLYNDPLQGAFDSVVEEDMVERFAKTSSLLGAVAEKADAAYRVLFENGAALDEVLVWKADLGVRIRRAYGMHDSLTLQTIAEEDIPALIGSLDAFYRTFRTQWMKHNKPFGFEVHTIRIGGLRQRILDTAETLERYLNGEISGISELEERALPLGYPGRELPVERLDYNRWKETVSTSRL